MGVDNSSKKSPKSSDQSLMRYMGLATQFFISIGIGLWIGLKADDYFKFSSPVFIWVLPLLIVLSSLIKIIVDTNKKNK